MDMAKSSHNQSLHRFAFFTAFCTLLLIALGGLVTSNEAGMSVPDWPTSYGYNMFLLPFKFWKGGVFYEHTHRLLASFVGMLTIVLAIWLWMRETRSWVRPMGLIAVGVVSMQGLIGGLRVVLSKDQLGVVHAALAQLFFLMLCSIALFTSQWWKNLEIQKPLSNFKSPWRGIFLTVTVLIFAQLLIGATMRHQHAGLAIHDFPLAYGKIWPATDAHSIEVYNQTRSDVIEGNPITATQVILQMVHRCMAYSILALVAGVAWKSRRELGAAHPLAKVSTVWISLLLVQVLLGAATIWSNKAADIATLHVVVGALSLATGAVLTIVSFKVLMPVGLQMKTGSEPEISGVGGYSGHAGTVAK
jgi:cytochrome c oxidase assembly protein subunit 15